MIPIPTVSHEPGRPISEQDHNSIHRINQFQLYTISSSYFSRLQCQFEPLREEVIPAKKAKVSTTTSQKEEES